MPKESRLFEPGITSLRKERPKFIEKIRVLFETDYFRVDPKRAYEFLYLQDRSETKFRVDLQIPIGRHASMRYVGYVTGGVSDRAISSYQYNLFPDEYQQPVYVPGGSYNVNKYLAEHPVLENPEPVFGGYHEVFKPGNIVLDIGSGEAVAAMQLAIKFPETTIIGTDVLYQDERPVYLKRSGLQLTYVDWNELKIIPDASVDAILSNQGITMWGMPGAAEGTITEADGHAVIKALNRVSKSGTIIRFDMKNQFLCDNIGSDWEISPRDDLFLARRR